MRNLSNTLTVSDSFARRAVGAVAGLGGGCGAIGGMVIAKLVGHIPFKSHDSYVIPFAIGGSTYRVALGAINLLVPWIGERVAGVTARFVCGLEVVLVGFLMSPVGELLPTGDTRRLDCRAPSPLPSSGARGWARRYD